MFKTFRKKLARILDPKDEEIKKDASKELKPDSAERVEKIQELKKRIREERYNSSDSNSNIAKEGKNGLELRLNEEYKINDALALSKYLKQQVTKNPEEATQTFLEIEKASKEQALGIMHILAQNQLHLKKIERIEKALIGDEDVAVSKALLSQVKEIRKKLEGVESKDSTTLDELKEIDLGLSGVEDRLSTMPLWGKALKLIQSRKGGEVSIEEICKATGKDYSRNSDRKQVYAALKHVENSPEFSVEVVKKGREKFYYAKTLEDNE